MEWPLVLATAHACSECSGPFGALSLRCVFSDFVHLLDCYQYTECHDLCVLAGRREQTSLSIYVAFDGPLDQHFMRRPSKLFGATVETPQVDPSNLILLQQHVVCASVELPLVPYLDQAFFGQVRCNSLLSPAAGRRSMIFCQFICVSTLLQGLRAQSDVDQKGQL